MFGYGQVIIDDIREQELFEERKRTFTTSTVAPLPVAFKDEADLSVTIKISDESNDVHLDQSNHGFSFINLHWASFSTRLSSVLAVLISLLHIAGCCYLHGSRQGQSRARHTELLRTIDTGATKAISTPAHNQPGAYPGPALPVLHLPALPSPADDRVLFEPSLVPSRGSAVHPVVRYTPGLPLHRPAVSRAVPLPTPVVPQPSPSLMVPTSNSFTTTPAPR